MNILFLITARGGSKGLPGKNSKKLAGKPLIHYTIEAAREVAEDQHICVSTDCKDIIKTVEEIDLQIPFIRPSELATDTAGSYGVIKHALNFYENRNVFYDTVVLLQPTSPFRNSNNIREALNLFSGDIDMLVSVKETDANPYYVLFEEDKNGYLVKSKTAENIYRRQDAPKVYELNGAIYVINAKSFKKCKSLGELQKTKKYLMNKIASIDIDDEFDWLLCEYILNQKKKY